MRRLLPLFLFLPLSCATSVAAKPSPEVLAPANLEVQDMEGTHHDIEAMLATGKPVALLFWQTWCESCHRQAPRVVEAAHDLGEDIAFFGVVSGPDDLVDDSKVRKAVAELGLFFPQVRDRDLALSDRFEIVGTPTILVMDEDGSLLFKGHESPEHWEEFAKGTH